MLLRIMAVVKINKNTILNYNQLECLFDINLFIALQKLYYTQT